MANYFEITVSGRQLAGTILGVLLVIAVAFGLGVAVGLQEPNRPTPGTAAVAIAPEPTFPPARAVVPEVPTAPPTPLNAEVAATLRGDAGPIAASSAPPSAGDAERPAASPIASPPATPAPTPVPVPTATPKPTAAARSGVWVQVVAVTHQSSAAQARERVVRDGFLPGQVVVERGNDGKYRVRVGPFPDEESASRVADRLRLRGFRGAFLVRE